MLHLQLSERDVERLLAGDQPQGRPDLAEVARFVARLRALGDIEYAPPMSPRLLAELDLAEADQTRLDDELSRRVEARKRAHDARRRWRLVGAAAMVAMLGGVVAAQARDEAPPQAPSDTTGTTKGSTPQDPNVTTSEVPQASNGPKSPPTTAPTTTAPQQSHDDANDRTESDTRGGDLPPGAPSATPDDQPPDLTGGWAPPCGSDPACWWDYWSHYTPDGGRP